MCIRDSRGVEDIFIACTDNLTGFDAAIHASFPQTEIQNCILHQLRNSSRYVSYKDIRALMADLKAVYAAVDEQAALNALDAFGERWDCLLYTSIAGAICAAKAHKREILVDMMAVPLNEIADRTRIAAQLGADYVCVHTSLDVKDAVDPFRSIEAARQGSDNIHIAVAGGINLKTIRSLVAVKPDVIIVGGALVKAADPVAVAAELRMQMGG